MVDGKTFPFLWRRADGLDLDLSIIPRDLDSGAVPWNRYYDLLCTNDESSKDLWSGQQHILEITASAVVVRLHNTRELFGKSNE